MGGGICSSLVCSDPEEKQTNAMEARKGRGREKEANRVSIGLKTSSLSSTERAERRFLLINLTQCDWGLPEDVADTWALTLKHQVLEGSIHIQTQSET